MTVMQDLEKAQQAKEKAEMSQKPHDYLVAAALLDAVGYHNAEKSCRQVAESLTRHPNIRAGA